MSCRAFLAPAGQEFGQSVFQSLIHDLFTFVQETAQAHPLWCFPIAAAIAFSECFVGISALIPGTVLLLAMAGVIESSQIPMLPAIIGAFLGSMAGDWICYLIGLTYVAKQETLGEVRNLWPLLFLTAPLAYAIAGALDGPTAAALAAAFALWVAVALWFLWRRHAGDVPRAVVSLIAGISLLDAVLIATTGAAAVAWLATLGFLLTLALQRVVPGT